MKWCVFLKAFNMDICTIFQQECSHIFAAMPCSQDKRRLSIIGLGLNVSSTVNQQWSNFFVSFPGSKMKGWISPFVFGVDIRTIVDQQGNNVSVPLDGSPMKWCVFLLVYISQKCSQIIVAMRASHVKRGLTLIGLCLNVSSFVNQQWSDFFVAVFVPVFGSFMKGWPSQYVSGVDIRAIVDQQGDNVSVPLPGSRVKWCVFILVFDVDICTIFQQKCSHIFAAKHGSHMKRFPSPFVSWVDIRAIVNQQGDNVSVPLPGSLVKCCVFMDICTLFQQKCSHIFVA